MIFLLCTKLERNLVMSLFYPNIYQKNILSIDYKKLKEKGIKLLIYDLDNTIISYETNILDKEIIDLFKELKKSFQIVVLSNTTNPNKIKNICNTNYNIGDICS